MNGQGCVKQALGLTSFLVLFAIAVRPYPLEENKKREFEATKGLKPIVTKRAIEHLNPMLYKRAIVGKNPIFYERATCLEIPKVQKRAKI